MTVTRVFVVIFLCYLLAFFAHALLLQKTVYGDGIFYYSWLRSAVVDHDIDFSDEYARFNVSQPKTPLGMLGNKYSIGPALVWSPGFFAVHTLLRGDGYTLPYQLAAGMTSMLAALFGLVLLLRILPSGKNSNLLAIIGIAFATNLLFYGSLDTVNSHALSFAAAIVFISLTKLRKLSWAALGVALSFLALMRLQDLVYVIILLPLWKKIQWVPFVTGFLLAFSPQLLAWSALNGSIVSPYLLGSEGFHVLSPHILGVLFSAQNGLFLWTPVAFIGAIGLIIAKKWWYLAVFAGELLIVSTWSTWWQGASFSGRMFVSSLPIIAMGLATFLSKLTKRGTVIPMTLCMAALSFLNAVSIVYFLLMLPA